MAFEKPHTKTAAAIVIICIIMAVVGSIMLAAASTSSNPTSVRTAGAVMLSFGVLIGAIATVNWIQV